MLPKWCNTTKEQELSRPHHKKLSSNGGFARHEPPTRRRRALRGPHVVQNPHCPQLKLLQRASQIITRYTLALQTEDREYQETGLHPLETG